MVKMPAEVRETLEKQKPIPIATASKSGVPNVVFVGLLKIVDDETLMLADNFFYKTAQNLAENPKISILCYNGDTKKSFQIKGNVTVCKEGRELRSDEGLGARHQQQAACEELRYGQDHGDLQRHVGTGGGETGSLSR